jgi:hypothetical protein
MEAAAYGVANQKEPAPRRQPAFTKAENGL